MKIPLSHPHGYSNHRIFFPNGPSLTVYPQKPETFEVLFLNLSFFEFMRNLKVFLLSLISIFFSVEALEA